MVGRTNIEDMENISINNSSDVITHLRDKNTELARALAETKLTLNQMLQERNILQRELFSCQLRCTKYETHISRIDASAQACLSSIVGSSNYLTDIILSNKRFFQNNRRASNTFRKDDGNSSNNSNKTQAVKPMVSGHVIFRPTINLQRYNENSLPEELQNAQTPNQQFNGNHEENSDSEEFLAAADDNNLPEDVNSESSGMENDTSTDMYPIIEENTNDSELDTTTRGIRRSLGPNSQMPLLSGVFRDVRVYLSPMANDFENVKSPETINMRSGNSRNIRRTRSSVKLASGSAVVENATQNSTNNNNLNTVCDNSFVLPSNDSSVLTSTKVNDNSVTIGSQASSSKTLISNSRDFTDWYTISAEENATGTDTSCLEPSAPLHNPQSSTFVSHDDPLEGPSTLLDSINYTKQQVLEGLGLTPAKSISSPTPGMCNPGTNGSNISKIRLTRSRITKRKISSKKEGVFPKVYVNRLSNELSSKLSNGKSISSYSTLLTTSSSSVAESTPLPLASTSESVISTAKIRCRRSTQQIAVQEKLNDSGSQVPVRPKRNVAVVSLKEPSLRRKLRSCK